MNNQNQQQNTLDPEAVNLTKAIRQTESGGNFQAKGGSGEYGAYQWEPSTWTAMSQQAGVNVPLQQATPEQQNQVAYTQVKKWKDAGYNVGQIASMWNAGEKNPNAYKQNDSGTNSSGQKYDVGAYAKSVATAYQTLKSGGQVQSDPTNPSSTTNPQNQNSSQSSPQPSNPLQQTNPKFLGSSTAGNIVTGIDKGTLNTVDQASNFGNWVGNQTAGRVINAIQGKGFTPTNYGNDLSNVVGGQQNLSADEKSNNPQQGAISTATQAIEPALIPGEGFMNGAARGVEETSAMASKPIMELLARDTGTDATKLSTYTIRNSLRTAIKSQSLDSDTQTLAEQALKELEKAPAQIVKQSKGLMQGVKHAAEWGAGLGGSLYYGYKGLTGLYNKASGNTNSKTYGVAP